MKVKRKLAVLGLSAALVMGFSPMAFADPQVVNVSNDTSDPGYPYGSEASADVALYFNNSVQPAQGSEGYASDSIVLESGDIRHAWYVTVDAQSLTWNVKQTAISTPTKITWNNSTHMYDKSGGGTSYQTEIDDSDTAPRTLTITNNSNFSVNMTIGVKAEGKMADFEIKRNSDNAVLAPNNNTPINYASGTNSAALTVTPDFGTVQHLTDGEQQVGTIAITLTANGDVAAVNTHQGTGWQ
jgi:hypothetical protein